MRLLIRLVLATAFIYWAYPHIVEFVENKNSMAANELLKKSDQIGHDYEDALKSKSDKLIATLEDLSIYDNGLKRCIKNELGRMYGGNIEHVTELTGLLCDSMGINSLSGIGGLSNLKSLSLRNNNITSVSEVTDLDKLQSLDLYGNPEISDFTSLSRVDNLKHLSVSNLSGTYCREVEDVIEHVKSNKTGYGSNTSTRNLMRGIQCRGAGNFDVEHLNRKIQRGERLTTEERSQLNDYQIDQRSR